jgi:hypothetical protein
VLRKNLLGVAFLNGSVQITLVKHQRVRFRHERGMEGTSKHHLRFASFRRHMLERDLRKEYENEEDETSVKIQKANACKRMHTHTHTHTHTHKSKTRNIHTTTNLHTRYTLFPTMVSASITISRKPHVRAPSPEKRNSLEEN